MPSKNSLSGFKDPKTSTSVLPDSSAAPAAATKPGKVVRVNKGFKVEVSRARRWDILVAHQKSNGKNGPMLIDEALDYLFSKYNVES